MKITRAADFAIRVLTYLASNNNEITSEELANRLDIPLNHLAKIVQTLARKGYLITKKGKNGGIKLGVDPKKINLNDVYETMEGPILLSECIMHKANCRFSGGCKVRKCLNKIRIEMQQILMGTSVFDLVPASW